tara:strand:+ start:265 stop:1059 length:795 start_codon:yes stop_codon:yes gene_type:complete
MITRVNNITQINNESISNGFTVGQLTADYDDSTAITSIAVSATAIDLKDGDKFIVSGVEFTVSADAAATATSISVDSITPSIPIQIGDKLKISKENLFVQYQRKTEGTIAGMPITSDSIGKLEYKGGVYGFPGVDPIYVKILPRDFVINDDGGNEALEFKDGTNTGLIVGATSQEMIATVNIPYGTTATEVTIWSSSTGRTVEVYEASIAANGIGSAIGTGTSNGSAIDITDTAATTTNYLVILVKVTTTSQRVYGGKVTLTQN